MEKRCLNFMYQISSCNLDKNKCMINGFGRNVCENYLMEKKE